ncbi:MAG: hypothetical protein LBH62_02560 [Nitrososphaerota archaeon]|nr:hypothetical protein [Nitrososphaerota archaeon]
MISHDYIQSMYYGVNVPYGNQTRHRYVVECSQLVNTNFNLKLILPIRA